MVTGGRGRTLTVTIVGDADSLQRMLRASGREVDDFERHIGGASTSILSKFTAVTAGAAVLAGGLAVTANVARGLAQDASDLAESQSKVNVVFGAGAPAIHAWAQTAAEAMGLSRQQATDAAGSFGNLFVQLGLADSEAVQMSTSIVQLAADFGSFHNADITDVLIAQQAAFRGEYDAVQRFVPVINAAAVEEQALRMGLAKTTTELDAQDKALATYALLMEGAGDAAGDFERTSESLANQQRTLEAKVADLRTELGIRLLPFMEDVTGALIDLIDQHGEEWAADFGDAVQGAADKTGDLFEALNKIVNSSPFQVTVEVVTTGLDRLQNLFDTLGAASSIHFQLAKWGTDLIGKPELIGAAVRYAVSGGATPIEDPTPSRVWPSDLDSMDVSRGIPLPEPEAPVPEGRPRRSLPARAPSAGRGGGGRSAADREAERLAKEEADRQALIAQIDIERRTALASKAMDELAESTRALREEQDKLAEASRRAGDSLLGFVQSSEGQLILGGMSSSEAAAFLGQLAGNLGTTYSNGVIGGPLPMDSGYMG